jgi:hypothetical protein
MNTLSLLMLSNFCSILFKLKTIVSLRGLLIAKLPVGAGDVWGYETEKKVLNELIKSDKIVISSLLFTAGILGS